MESLECKQNTKKATLHAHFNGQMTASRLVHIVWNTILWFLAILISVFTEDPILYALANYQKSIHLT